MRLTLKDLRSLFSFRPLLVPVLVLSSAACDLVSENDGPKPEDFMLESDQVNPNGDGTTPGGFDPKSTDGEKSGKETDVDCGGPSAPKCADGKVCKEATDCASGVCAANACAAPSPTDGVANGDETDVDCGGAGAPKCPTGKSCKAGSDCTIGFCGADNKCQATPSCNAKIGAGNHCGPNGDESCCMAARVPNVGASVDYVNQTWGLYAHVSAFKLDKYEVTVGRLRAFFTAMDGNPRANFEKTMGPNAGKHPKIANSGWKSTWTRRLPNSWANIDSRYGDPAKANGGTQFCMRGAGGDWGTTTWAHDPDTNAKLEANFDVKPVVCLDWYTLFAFCAWDGGRLPTTAEWGLAASEDLGWTYAWGNGTPDASKAVMALNGFEQPWPNLTWGENTRFPFDRGTHIAPPGRKAAGRFGHYDLAGNVAEWLLDSTNPTGECNDCANIAGWKDPTLDWPEYEPKLGAKHPTWLDGGTRVARGGSWEGHDTRSLQGTWNGVEVGFTYHALGGRCARDL